MKHLHRPVLVLILLIASTLTTIHSAEKTFGDYTIHYSAFNADFLSPSVAKAYNIQRSKNRAVLNVTVLKKAGAALPQPVQANVSGTAITVYQRSEQLLLYCGISGYQRRNTQFQTPCKCGRRGHW